MLIDSHIHVGPFNHLYFAPSIVSRLMEQIGVSYYAVSSTRQCEENYPKVLEEIEELILLDKEKILPVMWITPEGIQGNIAWYLESEIKWKMLKIHPFLNKEEWVPGRGCIEEVVDIARELQLPLLIHTGQDECCHANLFEHTISANPDVNFILAHGRPLFQTISMLQEHPNVYADSAFMPIDDMKIMIKSDLAEKLLWGTDMCIPKYYFPEEDMLSYYKRKLQEFKAISSEDQFEQVTYKNAIKLFNL